MKQAQELDRLLDLLQKGIISSEEFDIQKAALIQRYESMPSGPMVGFLPAYKSYWQNIFRWRGRSTRAEYWWPMLGNFIIGFAIGYVFGGKNPTAYSIFSLVWTIANFIAGLALMARRGHDFGKSARFSLFPWLSCITLALFLALFAVTGQIIDYTTRGNPIIWFKTFRSIIFIIGGFGIIGFAFLAGIWGIIVGFTPSQKFPNIYGDPK
ncbi:MAG: DUF805 domain-containing protein [Alphaproteobacteria bacterium]|nr:DUF805 domain-containing protein [Alphaproteobacteria bacterium]